MPRYHACWSAGGILGAAAGAGAAKLGTPVPVHFGIASLVGAVLLLVGLRFFIADRADQATEERRQSALGILRDRRVMAIGIVTLCSVIVEGAAADWLNLYLVDDRQASAAVGAAGYAIFAVAMTAGRFAGTPVSGRLGRHRAVGYGGLIATAGVLITVLSPWLALNYLGAALWALGICLIFPAAISAAGETDRPTDAIAAVSTLGYGASLVGPPLIGFLANRVGLGHALLVLVALGLAITALAPAVRRA
jgi:fucose permease